MNRPLKTALCLALLLAGWLLVPQRAVADYSTTIIRRTNLVRAQHGLRPLRVSARLTRAAMYHARRMAARHQAAHVLDGQGPAQRLAMFGYRWRSYGENVAWNRGHRDPAATAMDGWLRSPPHRANILGRQFTEIGVGWARAGNGTVYFCQLFGTPR